MHYRNTLFIAAVVLVLIPQVCMAQAQFQGRVWAPRDPGVKVPESDGYIRSYFGHDAPGIPGDMRALSNVRCYAAQDGPGSEAASFRSWEMAPSGWYWLRGHAGNYSLLFSGGAGHIMFTRPVIHTNVPLRPGEGLDRLITYEFDYFMFHERGWDESAARGYYQTFRARGTSITSVGFKPVHDGVDGYGAGGQNVLVSIHKAGEGTPDTWEQVGPSALVIHMDSGGGKDYEVSVGWNSGDVPTVPGEIYAVCLKPENEHGSFQMYWDSDGLQDTECFRVNADWICEPTGKDVWMAVSSDSDGLLIPYNKRIQKEFEQFAGYYPKWSQTYVAQGHSLAGVLLYAAALTNHPSMGRQRVAVRVREGGPDGPVVGIEKIAIGEANFTGDASWGAYGTAFAPGEVPLVPGTTYALEFETLENYASLHGYINIKNHAADINPGFNPYRKHSADQYEHGSAFLNGEDMGFDLEMIVIEYEHPASDWATAVTGDNLLDNGNMQAGTLDAESPEEAVVDAWKTFIIDEGTIFQYIEDPEKFGNRFVRILGGTATGKTVDGGWVQRVEGLKRQDTYRLSARLRSTFPTTPDHVCSVGYDPTGQTDDPNAQTIVWEHPIKLHSHFIPYLSNPIRPDGDSISVWLRARTNTMADYPFRADFDDVSLRRVNTGAPPYPLEVKLEELHERVNSMIQSYPRRPVQSGAEMKTKLGLYYIMGESESEGFYTLARSGFVPVVKTGSQSTNRSHTVVQHNPEAIWIVGVDLAMQMNSDRWTPKEAADDAYRRAQTAWGHIKHESWRNRVDYLELVQIMWEPKTPEQAIWWGHFLCELLPRIAEMGPRPIVINSGVGGLPVDKPEILRHMVPGLRLAHHFGGAWGYHGYTIDYTTDLNTEIWYSLRYRQAYNWFEKNAPEIADFPILLLEGGVDRVGDALKDGWLARGTLEDYTSWLAWYDKELMKDDYCLGVTLFKIGAPSIWQSFEMEPVVPWLLEHYQRVNQE